jgi:nucleoside-diphosphate-sugar epimerase
MRCIVTGGAGFIGSNLVDRLVKDGHEVQVWDNLSTGKKENINIDAVFIQCDISKSYDARKQLMSDFKPDVVFHLAAMARVQPSIENPIEFHNINVNGTLNLLKMSAECNVKRFVFSSSSSVYGNVEQLPTSEEHKLRTHRDLYVRESPNPMSPYALHKLIGEQYCKLFSELYGLETVCLRYFNVYGERQNTEGAYKLVIPIFTQQLLNGEPMTVRGDGEQRRDFTYVGDVVDANVRCMDYPLELNGDVFNIGNGDNRSVNQIADMLGGDKINVEPVIEPKETLADNSKAKRVLGWKPTTELEDWITKYKEEIGL